MFKNVWDLYVRILDCKRVNLELRAHKSSQRKFDARCIRVGFDS